MNINKQLANHIRDVHFGGNWTCSNLKDQLSEVTWEEAIAELNSFNSIVKLLFHINYFIDAVAHVLEGNELNAHDKSSFDPPAIQSQADWDKLKDKSWNDAERLASLIELLPDAKLNDYFTDVKYGNYFRNLLGIIEHSHYHFGQISILKKIIREGI